MLEGYVLGLVPGVILGAIGMALLISRKRIANMGDLKTQIGHLENRLAAVESTLKPQTEIKKKRTRRTASKKTVKKRVKKKQVREKSPVVPQSETPSKEKPEAQSRSTRKKPQSAGEPPEELG